MIRSKIVGTISQKYYNTQMAKNAMGGSVS